MIVIEANTHKASHTLGAVDAATARVIVDLTVRAKRRSFDDLQVWARGVSGERVWAIEDCRHVFGDLERFLLARGERVVRMPPKLMAGARNSARERGKSDAIDAVAIACAAIREGLETLRAQRELAVLVAQLASRLLAERGYGVLTAATLIGEIAGIHRFSSDAKLARLAGAAPIPASSGQTDRHRLDKGGSRQLNCALHRLAIAKGRFDPLMSAARRC